MVNTADYKIVSSDDALVRSASNINNGRWYKIIADNNGSVSNATSIQNGGYYEVVAADQNVPTAASAVALNKYYRHSGAGTINGDTDWRLFGWDGVSAIFKVTTIPAVALRGTSSAVETTDFSRLNGRECWCGG